MTRATKLRLLKISFFFVIILVAYGIFEIGGRVFFRDKLLNFLFVRSPESIDHRLPPNRKFKINSDGIRSTHEADYYTEDQYNIMILGDSFTFGWALHLEQAFPYRLERLLRQGHQNHRIHVINCGWISASPLLQYRLLRDVVHKYKPDLVIQAFDMTDFHDDIQYRYMFNKRGIYWWYNKIPCTLFLIFEYIPSLGSWLYNRSFDYTLPEDRFFPSAGPLEETRPLLQHSLDNLIRINSLCKEIGVQFMTVVCPRAYQYSTEECQGSWENPRYEIMGPYSLEPFRFFETIKDSVDFPIVSLLDAFRQSQRFPLYYESDPHWNAQGNLVCAEAIYELLGPQGPHSIADDLP
jgi:hypothetical protein